MGQQNIGIVENVRVQNMRLKKVRLNYVTIICESNKIKSKKCAIKICESKRWAKNLTKNSERKYMGVKYE